MNTVPGVYRLQLHHSHYSSFFKNCHLIPLSDDSRSDDVDSDGVVVVIDVVEEGDVAGQLQHGHEEAKNAQNQHG